MNGTRDHYFPNTEPLAANEMRVIALWTGRPFVRRAQANCSWLIELGNGDKFIMDFGSGSQVNFTALEIPHQDITAYFGHPPSCRSCWRLCAGLDRELGGRSRQ